MAFNRAAALKAGYTDQEIDQYLASQSAKAAPSPVVQTAQANLAQPQAPQQGGNVVSNLLSSLTKPFVQTGKNIGGAAFELSRAGAKKVADDTIIGKALGIQGKGQNLYNNPETGEMVQNPFLNEQELTKASQPIQLSDLNVLNPNNNSALGQQIKNSANVGAYAVPFGKGANLLTKALLPGAAAGALQGVSQDNATAGSVLGSGVLGGATAGALDKLGPVLGKLLGKTGGGLENAGEGILKTQYASVPKAIRQAQRLDETIPQLAEYGIKNIKNVIPTAERVTGDTGIISDLTRNAVSKAGRVKVDNLMSLAENLAQDPLIPAGQDTKFVNFIKKGLGNLTDTGSTNISDAVTGNPEKTFDFIKQLEKQAASIYKGKSPSMVSANDQALASSYRNFADELKTRLFSGAGADNAAVDLVNQPQYLEQLRAISPKLAEAAQKSETLGQLRSVAAPFVRGSKLAEAAQNAPKKLLGLTDILAAGGGYLSKGPVGAVGMLALQKGAESNAVKSAVGSGLLKSGELAASLGPRIAGNRIGPVAGQLASRLPASLSSALFGVSGENPSFNSPLNNLSNNANQNTEPNINGQRPQSNTNPNQETNSNVITNQFVPPEGSNNGVSVPQSSSKRITPDQLMAVILAPGISDKTKDNIKQLYQIQQKDNAGGKPTTSEGLKTQAKAKTGLAALQAIQAELDKNPNTPLINLIGGGNLSRDYEANASSLTDVLGGLRTGASVSKEQQQFYRNLLPKAGDSKETQARKLKALQDELNLYLRGSQQIQDPSNQLLQSLQFQGVPMGQ